jgi:glycosyltransferase involved in cell wall biosynthesis
MDLSRVLAVIPAFNEAGRIGRVIAGLRELGLAVLVVDDGSGDETAQVARAAGAQVLRKHNGGKGSALRAGCIWAIHHQASAVLLLDGDGQHDPQEARRLLAAAPGVELVIGRRMLAQARQPTYRRCFNRLSSLMVTLAAGRRIRDSQSGYRLLDPRLLLRLPLRGCRYDLESEMCVLVARAGLRIAEVPITVIYHDKRSGVHPLWDTARFFWAVGVAAANSRVRLPRWRQERLPALAPSLPLPSRSARALPSHAGLTLEPSG